MPEQSRTGKEKERADRVDLGFGNLYASVGHHIGHFYQTREEWKNLAAPFLQTGLESGEKCMYFISAERGMRELRESLAAAGTDTEGVLKSGQLVLDEGKSDPKGMQDALQSALAEIPGKFPLLRWAGDMTWSLKKLPTAESLMEWETHCNTIENPPAVFLCQYDLRSFHGNVVMDALRTHPVCIISNVIHQNPYYETPEVYLEELRRRDTTALA